MSRGTDEDKTVSGRGSQGKGSNTVTVFLIQESSFLITVALPLSKALTMTLPTLQTNTRNQEAHGTFPRARI